MCCHRLSAAVTAQPFQMAMNIARQRDVFHFYSAFFVPAALALTAAYVLMHLVPAWLLELWVLTSWWLCDRAIKKRNPALLGPLLPLGTAWTYQYDMACTCTLVAGSWLTGECSPPCAC